MSSPNLKTQSSPPSAAGPTFTPCRYSWQSLLCLYLALPALLSLQSGCIYLHNDARAKQSESVLAQYRGFQTNSGSVFGLMLENHAKVQQGLAERQAADAEIKFRAYASGLPSMRLSDLKDELEGLQKTSLTRRADLEVGFAAAVKQQVAAKIDLKTLSEALKELQTQIKAAENEHDQWMAREELFKGILQFYTDQTTNFSKADQALLKKANDEILGRKIGNKTIADLLSPDLKNLEDFKIAAGTGPYTINFFDPRKAPGLKIQLLSLGADLAAARLKRVKLDISRLTTLNGSWQKQQAALNLQEKHLGKALESINNYLAANKDGVVSVEVALLQKAASDNAKASLSIFGRGFTYYLLAVTYDESAIRELETQPSAIAHEYAIRLNQINEQEREAFVLRGLESLNLYHQGGITSEQVANLLGAAQAAGIGVIGAGVLR